MFGYNNRYFSTNLLASLSKAMNESLAKSGSRNGIGISNDIKETYDRREPGRSVQQISDLELQRRMKLTKNTSIFGQQKQSKEYLELEAEANRRAGAPAAPAAPAASTAGAPAAAKPAAPVSKSVAPQTDGLSTSGRSTAMPFDEPSSPAAPKATEKPATAPGFMTSPEGKPDEPTPEPNLTPTRSPFKPKPMNIGDFSKQTPTSIRLPGVNFPR